MPPATPRSRILLLGAARRALLKSQTDIANLCGVSLRTVQRWDTGRSTPSAWHIHAVVDALQAVDPELAAELEMWAPRPKAPEVASPPEEACSAADAVAMLPDAVRPAIHAAFARAAEAGLTMREVVDVLGAHLQPELDEDAVIAEG